MVRLNAFRRAEEVGLCFCLHPLVQEEVRTKQCVLSPIDTCRNCVFPRVLQSVPVVLRPLSSDGEDLELVARHRVLVCTCATAGLMYSLGLTAGHFTHAFIDEVLPMNMAILKCGLFGRTEERSNTERGAPRKLRLVFIGLHTALFTSALGGARLLCSDQFLCVHRQSRNYTV